jgi:hypothetical protein
VTEEAEIETTRIDEQIKEQIEREGGSLLKAIALSTRCSRRWPQSRLCARAEPSTKR